jgi:hypothetical protein
MGALWIAGGRVGVIRQTGNTRIFRDESYDTEQIRTCFFTSKGLAIVITGVVVRIEA